MVEALTRELARAIVESPEYREYERCKKRVAEEPELHRQINKFRRAGYILQKTKQGGELYEGMERLESEYREFCEDPRMMEYMAAELSVCRLMQKVNQELLSAIDLEMDSIEEIETEPASLWL